MSHMSVDMLTTILHKIVAQPLVDEAVQKFLGVDKCQRQRDWARVLQ